ncbi:MAG: substrate-binding domain-containing protein [Verrucomicrobia bacterium]|nr:substrate-binding domain-containing protein [Verrucomicrobiota bacterium]
MGLVSPTSAQQKKLNSIGLTLGDLGNPFFVQVAHGVEAQAKRINPAVKIISVSSNYDVHVQDDQIKDFIAQKVDLIILNAADSKKIAAAVKRAKAAHIVVIAVDVGAEGGVDATIESNNKQAGEEAAQYMADRLKGKGQVVIVNGPAVTSVQDRIAGALGVFKKYPDIKVPPRTPNALGTPEDGMRIMTDSLTAYPKLASAFAINDPTALGCDQAARKAGRSDLFIVGVDGSPDAVAALKSPGSLFAATAAQDPFAMAEKAVEVGNDIMNGHKPADTTILIPVKLVTRETVNQYQGWTR